MAAGTTYILDNPSVDWAGTDISGYCAQAMVAVRHIEVAVPHTYGQDGAQRAVSDHYDWSVTLRLIHDGFGNGTLNKAITDRMKPPLGPATGTGEAQITIRPGGTGTITADNPSCVGNVVVSEWEPLGSGEAGTIAQQTRTFNGTGNLTWSDS